MAILDANIVTKEVYFFFFSFCLIFFVKSFSAHLFRMSFLFMSYERHTWAAFSDVK